MHPDSLEVGPPPQNFFSVATKTKKRLKKNMLAIFLGQYIFRVRALLSGLFSTNPKNSRFGEKTTPEISWPRNLSNHALVVGIRSTAQRSTKPL